MKQFRAAKRRIEVSVGESVRILRELQELTQSQLAELTGIRQTTISPIENGRVNLGVERAKVLAFSDRLRAFAGIKGQVSIRIAQSQRRTRDR
jgi:transcriptional regulator with XRE-family HTH domain